MGKQRFEDWLSGDLGGRFFILERRVNQARFENWYVPEILRKLGASRALWVRKLQEWEERAREFSLPSLFPEREVCFLDRLDEGEALHVFREASRYPEVYFFFLPGGDLKGAGWSKVPWIVVEEDREVLQRFLQGEAARLGLSFGKGVEEHILRLFEEYELQETEIVSFLEGFRGRRVQREDVEAFFEKNEKILLFRFLDFLGERNTSLALQYAYRLVGQGFPLPLLVTHLARRFRLLAQVFEKGETQRDLWQGKEVNPFEMKKIQKMKDAFSPADIPRIFATLRMADRLLKTQSIDPRLFCVLLVTGVTQPEKPLPG